MTPFDTTTTSAITARNLLQFSGGILCQPGVVTTGYLTNDPAQSSSSGVAAYLAEADVVAANFQIQVTSNTADTQTSLQLFVNNAPVASQNINAGFTGPLTVKAAQGVAIPAGATIAVFMTNPGTIGAGQRVNVSGVFSYLTPQSPARPLNLFNYYFAGRNSCNVTAIITFGDDATECLVVSPAPLRPINSYPAPVVGSRASFISGTVTRFDGGPLSFGGVITIWKNGDQLVDVNLPDHGSFQEDLNASGLQFNPGDTIGCTYQVTPSENINVQIVFTIVLSRR